MEAEDFESSLGGLSDTEVCVLDENDDEICDTSHCMPKLQFRKDGLKARWKDSLAMAEVLDMKGQIWRTTGIVRNGKIYFSAEETLFLASIGALQLLDDDDECISLKDMKRKFAEPNSICCWESFEVYKHLKSLGFIVGRHSVPWTVKNVRNKSVSDEPTAEISRMVDGEFQSQGSMVELFNNMKINETRPIFDVYLPNSKFRKSFPGDPSFVLFLSSDRPPVGEDIKYLERQCNGTPPMVCHVVHGRPSFFSFSTVSLPLLP